jgi:flagellar protein FlaG
LTPASSLRQHESMNQQKPPAIRLVPTADYRESYSNSVQVRVNLWDFFLQFGTLHQTRPEEVEIKNFQGIYLSPQQAKALLNVLQQNVAQYENAFGEIKLDPNLAPTGTVN